MTRLILFVFLLIFSNSYGAYINERDMSNETQKIQRLLGQLDALKVYPSQTQRNNTPYAMLALATAGLAIAASSSSYYYDYPTYYHNKRYYPYQRIYYRNNVGTAVGATLATAGIIGAIASAAAAEESQNQQREKILSQQKIEKQINEIISNLIETDVDYNSEKETLKKTLINNIDKRILTINKSTSNDIAQLEKEKEKYLSNFNNMTNKIDQDITKLDQDTIKYIAQNIDKINSPNISSSTIKELKSLNKELKTKSAQKKKNLIKQKKEEIKNFNKSFPKISEKINTDINNLEEIKNQQILAEVESATSAENNLFQKYKSLYINKLSAY